MRITKELEGRIKRQFDELYKERFDVLYAKQEEQAEKVRVIVSKVVAELAIANPILWAYLSNQFHREMSLEEIKSNVFNKDRDAYDLEIPEAEELRVILKEINELKAEKKQAMEDLKIEIAYSKDLKSIKEIFSNFNLTF